MANLIESVRVQIPEDKVLHRGKASKFFEILDNTQGLTEEFLYAHQPVSKNTIPVYSTSEKRIGSLDKESIPSDFNIVDGPAIVVARKGYAGRLFVVEDTGFIVHEDAYPVKPREEYREDINLWWFVGHYSFEFQSDRTSFWGIGDFPRERFRNKMVILPIKQFQDEIAELYKRRSSVIVQIDRLKSTFHGWVDSLIAASPKSE